MKRERTLLLWINAVARNAALIDRSTYEKMDRRIRSSFDRQGK